MFVYFTRFSIVAFLLILASYINANDAVIKSNATKEATISANTVINESHFKYLGNIKSGYCLFKNKVFTYGAVIEMKSGLRQCSHLTNAARQIIGYEWVKYVASSHN